MLLVLVFVFFVVPVCGGPIATKKLVPVPMALIAPVCKIQMVSYASLIIYKYFMVF